MSSIKSFFIDLWECTADACASSLDCLCTTCSDFCLSLRDSPCCARSSKPRRTPNYQSTPPESRRTSPNRSVIPQASSSTSNQSPQSPQEPPSNSPSIIQYQPPPPPVTSPSAAPRQTPRSQSLEQLPPAQSPQAVKCPSAQQELMPQQPPSQQPQPSQKEVLPEPPRIEFVETGSLFGDRRRNFIDKRLHLLDNGRFRSPGLPKIIQGPGGRTIRVSFVSGFPMPNRSLESAKSVGTITSKGSLARPNEEGNRSIESLSKFKTAKSLKSYKSSNSTENKDTDGQNEINIKSINQ